jgi:hypothetical protein
MLKRAKFADERSDREIVLESLERNLEEALRRAADALEDVAIWQRMLSNLLRAAPGLTDPWAGLAIPPRSAMH